MKFNKANTLRALHTLVEDIAKREKFDRSNGTRQLSGNRTHDELIRRSVEYGRMRALEMFAENVEEGFEFLSSEGENDDQ